MAAGVSQLLRGLLFGVPSIDGVSTVSVLFLFFTIALLAAYVPSRQATRIDPVDALRYE
jgi:ABC-type antimicrobial peptide transport system permease subunit